MGGYGCSPVNLLPIFRNPFPKTVCGAVFVHLISTGYKLQDNVIFVWRDANLDFEG